MPFLQDLFDISIPGQRINEARALRSQRSAAEAERQRQAEAFKAIQSGDVLGAAARDPQLAAQYQGVQAGQQALGDASTERARAAAVRALRAVRAAGVRDGNYVGAFDQVASRAGTLFGSPEELAQVRGVLEQGGPQALDALEAALMEPQRRGTPAKPFAAIDGQGRRVFVQQDPETGQLAPIEGFSPEPPRGPSVDPTMQALREAQLRKVMREENAAVTEDDDAFLIEFGKDTLARAALGLPVIASANKRLDELFKGGSRLAKTPRNVAASAAGGVPLVGGVLERAVGDDERDALIQSAKAYESVLMPIMSGAAVTESEAERQLRAALPQIGDSDKTLAAKAKVRKLHEAMIRGGVTGKPISLRQIEEAAAAVEASYGAAEEDIYSAADAIVGD